MKPFMYVAFGVLLLAMIGLFGVGIYATTNWEDKDAPEVAAKKAECRKLMRHLFELSPQAKGDNLDERVAKVPIEDIEQCAAANPEAVACMQAAPDLERVQACIPVIVECAGPTTVVEGERPIYEIGGECETVQLKTAKASVNIKGAKKVELAGNDNHGSIRATEVVATGSRNQFQVKPRGEDKKAPSITDSGTDNKIVAETEKK